MEAIFVNIKNGLIFRIFDLFSSGFLHRINCNAIIESFLVCFVQFNFLTQNGRFCKGYSPWMEAHFANIENGLTFGIFDLF